MQRRVALVGMYGGYFGERNPGCFLILEAALRALGRRLPDATFDIYSEDAIGRFHGLRSELVHGRELRYFSSQWGQTLLETSLMGYDALVLGGDIILARRRRRRCSCSIRRRSSQRPARACSTTRRTRPCPARRSSTASTPSASATCASAQTTWACAPSMSATH
ncbi:hypothetical protein [Nannocystis pusilla]|uniref:hypothetical protein n=1 Tax=Nannocystis pusilla TaxID=889268 RepID=UPI003B7AFB67